MKHEKNKIAVAVAIILLALASMAGAAGPRRRDIQVVDTTPTSFTVAWTTDSASTGNLQVFADVLGTVPVNGIQIEPRFVSGSDVAVAVAAENLGILRVRVSGLQPRTPYFFRTLTTPKAGGAAIVVPQTGAAFSVVTESASFPEMANGLGVAVRATNGVTPQTGTLMLVSVAGAGHPLSALTSDGYANGVAAVDLGNFFNLSDGKTLRLNGGEQAKITILAGLSGQTSATPVLIPNTGLGLLQLLGAPVSLQPILDTDGDGMPNDYEIANGLNPSVNDAGLDADGDGLTNLQEFLQGTDPHLADSDGDGLSDGNEVNVRGTLPTVADTDRDGRNDGSEINGPPITNPLDADSDDDGVSDGVEVAHGTNPNNPNEYPILDGDGDGVPDKQDNCPTIPNPSQADANGDGRGDACATDDDGDGIADTADNCPLQSNAGQQDTDGDGVGDACDRCPNVADAGQEDNDNDGLGDLCDPDDDNDGVNDLHTPGPPSDVPFMLTSASGVVATSLPVVSNATAFIGVNKFFPGELRAVPLGYFDLKERTFTPTAVAPGDQNQVGWLTLGIDTNQCGCFQVAAGDSITIATNVGNVTALLAAGAENNHNIIFVATDGSTYSQFFLPDGPLANLLQSGQIAGPLDNCQFVANPSQLDSDGDGIGNACDNCPMVANPLQEDANGNGIGDVCEPSPTRTPTATPTPTVTATPTASPTPAPPLIDLGKSVGRPGGSACVAAVLNTRGSPVGATRNDIGFNATAFTFGACTINPSIGTGTATNKQVSHTPVSSGVERVNVSGANANLIPNGQLYSCTLSIGAAVAAGTYNLSNTVAAFDGAGNPLAGASGATGQIVVSTCNGDCDGNNQVSIGEVTKCVNLFLGQPLCNAASPALSCPVADSNLNGTVSIGEVTQCVNRFLNGCGA